MYLYFSINADNSILQRLIGITSWAEPLILRLGLLSPLLANRQARLSGRLCRPLPPSRLERCDQRLASVTHVDLTPHLPQRDESFQSDALRPASRSCAFGAHLESLLLGDPPKNPFSTASTHCGHWPIVTRS